MPDKVLAEPARHQEAERLEMEVVTDRPTPGVRDDETLDALRMLAREVETDRPAPIRHEQGDVTKVEVIEKRGEPVRVTFRMMVLAPGAARRETETDMVGRYAAELRPKYLDRITEFERPSRVTVDEYERLAFTLVDEVHSMS